MQISKAQLAAMLKGGCSEIVGAQEELTGIDSRFGDADHGVTMTKIAQAVAGAVNGGAGDVKTMLEDAAMAVMQINGGSAVPLWNTYLEGLSEQAPAADIVTKADLKAMFEGGLKAISALTKARVGDKTLMDTLIPATEALLSCESGVEDMLNAAARAAEAGAENTKNMVSKFGRARSYGEATLGTPDAGAVSMKYFFAGLAKKLI